MTGPTVLRFGVFFQGVNFSTVWTEPLSGSQTDFESFRRVAQTAERGLFSAFFLGEGLRLREHLGALHQLDVAGRPDAQTQLAALAAVTERIGLVATQNTTYNDPLDLAHRLASLDLLSGGRAAWNVVTTDNAAAARHLVDRCVEWGAGQFWLDFRSDNPVVRTRARAAEERLAELGLPWAPFEERRQLPASAGPPAVVGNAARQEFTEFPGGPLFGAFFDFWENRTPGLYRKVIICRQNFARISEISADMLRRLIAGETPAPAFIEIPPENYLEF